MRLNVVEPFTKPKYSLITDSELVLWRKGEKVSNIMELKRTEILS